MAFQMPWDSVAAAQTNTRGRGAPTVQSLPLLLPLTLGPAGTELCPAEATEG